MLINQVLLKEADLVSLKSDANELDIDKWKDVPLDLSSLESKVEKLYFDKLAPALADLSELSKVASKKLVKKDVNDELFQKVNAIRTTDTSDLVSNTSEKKLTTTQKLMKLK